MKRTKSLFVALLVMVICAVSLGFAQPAYAANENVLTVNVTDDYYGNPVDGVTVSVTDAATGAVVAEQVTNASGSATFSLPDGAYKVEQTKFKAGYVVDHSTKAVTFSGVARGTDDHQTVALEDVHIMGTLIPYVDAYIRTTPGFLTDVYFNVEDEFGNRIATSVQGGTPLTVPVTGSYTLIPTQYPSRLSYDSSAVMFAEIFRCTQGGYGIVPLHAVTFAYNQTSRRFADEVKAAVILPTRKGNIVVKVVDQDGNPVAGATLKATPSIENPPGYPYPACPPVTPVIPAPDPATLPGSDTPRAMTHTPGAPGVPYTQTGHVDRDADNNYLLTTGPDGTVVIPDYLVERESTITQLTTPDGYTIEDPNPQTAKITGTDTTAEVVFVNKKYEVPTPEPAPELNPEPQTPSAPKKKSSKKSVLPDTGDATILAQLFVGVLGTALVASRKFMTSRDN